VATRSESQVKERKDGSDAADGMVAMSMETPIDSNHRWCQLKIGLRRRELSRHNTSPVRR